LPESVTLSAPNTTMIGAGVPSGSVSYVGGLTPATVVAASVAGAGATVVGCSVAGVAGVVVGATDVGAADVAGDVVVTAWAADEEVAAAAGTDVEPDRWVGAVDAGVVDAVATGAVRLGSFAADESLRRTRNAITAPRARTSTAIVAITIGRRDRLGWSSSSSS
jgi:hypothetical protein